MKKRKCVSLVLTCALSAVLLLSGCGSSGSSDYKNAARDYTEGAYASESAADYDYGLYDMAPEYEEPYYEEGAGSEKTQVEEQKDSKRKLITTVNLTAETEDLTATISSVEGKVRELGGYIESSNIYNGSGSKYSTRDASLTVRIPSDKLDAFVESIEGSTNITRKTVNVDDVTLQYVDTESRKNSLKTEEKRLLDIMEKAETVEDIITIEDKLADVRYELESIESQLRSYDNLVDYSTIYLSVTEVAKYTPVEEESVFTRMGNGFMESVESVVEGFGDLCVAFVSSIPQIIVFIIVVVIIGFIVKKLIAVSKKRNAKKMAMMQPMMAANYQQPHMMGAQAVNAQGQAPNPVQNPNQGQAPNQAQTSEPVQNQNQAQAPDPVSSTDNKQEPQPEKNDNPKEENADKQ